MLWYRWESEPHRSAYLHLVDHLQKRDHLVTSGSVFNTSAFWKERNPSHDPTFLSEPQTRLRSLACRKNTGKTTKQAVRRKLGLHL